MKNKSAIKGSMLGKFSMLTLFAIYFLILIGGIVRSTGSGMGCPDWPKCFGAWIPPTSISKLPENYKEVYSEQRAQKNLKLVSYLNALGFEQKANEIANDESILEEADFNPLKTWIEYINRLIGAVIGLLVIGTVYFALPFRRSNPIVFYLAVMSLVLVLFQGWIGSLVVSTNLIPFMVTIHMLIALAIVAILCAIVIKANPQLQLVTGNYKKISITLIIAMLLMLIQVVLGTQVREAVDIVANSILNRSEWIANLGIDFTIHRSFSWIVLLSNGYLLFLISKEGIMNITTKLLISVVILAIASGTIMAYFAIPAVFQPVHLLLGSMGFGLQFFLFLQLQNKQLVPV